MDKVELTPEFIRELKQYAFAQYWGQMIVRIKDYPKIQHWVTLISLSWAMDKYIGATLELRALESITDAEAIEVAKMFRYNSDDNHLALIGRSKIKVLLEDCSEVDFYIAIKVYQYLQQNSFALQIYYKGQTITVPQLEAAGIIKLKG